MILRLCHRPVFTSRSAVLAWYGVSSYNIRDRLGWALAPESGGQTAVQRTSYYKYNHTYLKALDNNVWHLLPERSDWEN
jgi:hypothetical protein